MGFLLLLQGLNEIRKLKVARLPLVMQQPFWEDSPPIRVSPILEIHASPSQKARKIDLVDFLFVTQIAQITQIL